MNCFEIVFLSAPNLQRHFSTLHSGVIKPQFMYFPLGNAATRSLNPNQLLHYDCNLTDVQKTMSGGTIYLVVYNNELPQIDRRYREIEYNILHSLRGKCTKLPFTHRP